MTDWTDELRYAEREVNAARSGDLSSRLAYVRSAMVHLKAAEEAMALEIESDEPRQVAKTILVRFEGGPYDGEQMHWNGGRFIEVVERPPTPLVFDSPRDAVLKKFIYRIDDNPQPGGTYIARLT